eukprot:GHVL01023994.1.p1 GENE.GHVL01023994.1~~GHVL01023994.1.p1  ORF type:complete len:946 (-),score=158.62 GHVL01023994.1:92-2929(-)
MERIYDSNENELISCAHELFPINQKGAVDSVLVKSTNHCNIEGSSTGGRGGKSFVPHPVGQYCCPEADENKTFVTSKSYDVDTVGYSTPTQSKTIENVFEDSMIVNSLTTPQMREHLKDGIMNQCSGRRRNNRTPPVYRQAMQSLFTAASFIQPTPGTSALKVMLPALSDLDTLAENCHNAARIGSGRVGLLYLIVPEQMQREPSTDKTNNSILNDLSSSNDDEAFVFKIFKMQVKPVKSTQSNNTSEKLKTRSSTLMDLPPLTPSTARRYEDLMDFDPDGSPVNAARALKRASRELQTFATIQQRLEEHFGMGTCLRTLGRPLGIAATADRPGFFGILQGLGGGNWEEVLSERISAGSFPSATEISTALWKLSGTFLILTEVGVYLEDRRMANMLTSIPHVSGKQIAEWFQKEDPRYYDLARFSDPILIDFDQAETSCISSVDEAKHVMDFILYFALNLYSFVTRDTGSPGMPLPDTAFYNELYDELVEVMETHPSTPYNQFLVKLTNAWCTRISALTHENPDDMIKYESFHNVFCALRYLPSSYEDCFKDTQNESTEKKEIVIQSSEDLENNPSIIDAPLEMLLTATRLLVHISDPSSHKIIFDLEGYLRHNLIDDTKNIRSKVHDKNSEDTSSSPCTEASASPALLVCSTTVGKDGLCEIETSVGNKRCTRDSSSMHEIESSALSPNDSNEKRTFKRWCDIRHNDDASDDSSLSGLPPPFETPQNIEHYNDSLQPKKYRKETDDVLMPPPPETPKGKGSQSGPKSSIQEIAMMLSPASLAERKKKVFSMNQSTNDLRTINPHVTPCVVRLLRSKTTSLLRCQARTEEEIITRHQLFQMQSNKNELPVMQDIVASPSILQNCKSPFYQSVIDNENNESIVFTPKSVSSRTSEKRHKSNRSCKTGDGIIPVPVLLGVSAYIQEELRKNADNNELRKNDDNIEKP